MTNPKTYKLIVYPDKSFEIELVITPRPEYISVDAKRKDTGEIVTLLEIDNDGSCFHDFGDLGRFGLKWED